MQALQVFEFEAQEVRTIIKDGEPWFVSKDVCNILEIKNVSQAINRLEPSERNTITLNDSIISAGNPEKSIINESGLYTLILSSRKKESKRFRRWVTSEVLPEIRKTGGYNTTLPSDIQKQLDNITKQLEAYKPLLSLIPGIQSELSHINQEIFESHQTQLQLAHISPHTKSEIHFSSKKPSHTYKKEIYNLVKNYAEEKSLPLIIVWTDLYNKFKIKHGINLPAESNKQQIKPILDCAEKNGHIHTLYSIAEHYYNPEHKIVNDLLVDQSIYNEIIK